MESNDDIFSLLGKFILQEQNDDSKQKSLIQ